MSHFRDPTGISRSNDDPVFSWEGFEDAASTTVRIVGTSGENLDLDTTGCSYCANGADCDDGVFVIRSQTSNKDDGFGEAALVHVCRTENGTTRLNIVDNLASRPELSETYTAAGSIAWQIDEGTFHILVDGNASNPRHWPVADAPGD